MKDAVVPHVGGSWAYYDQLDDYVVQHGDRLQIQWPDGTKTEHVASVHEYHTSVSEQGGSTQVPVSEAKIMIDQHGAKTFTRITAVGAPMRVIGRSVRKYANDDPVVWSRGEVAVGWLVRWAEMDPDTGSWSYSLKADVKAERDTGVSCNSQYSTDGVPEEELEPVGQEAAHAR